MFPVPLAVVLSLSSARCVDQLRIDLQHDHATVSFAQVPAKEHRAHISHLTTYAFHMVAERGRPRLAEHIVDVLVPLIMEEIVEVLKTVFQEQISEKICKQIGDVYVSQVVEQVTEVPKTSSRDRTSQCTAEQILDVPAPEMVKQPVQAQDRIQRRTLEQTVDVPVPQAVEELIEVSQVFPQDMVHRRFVEQTIDIPANSLAEMIVQRVVDTVEVEKPKIIELTVQRKKPIIQEKINQGTKPIEFPQAQFLDKAGDMPVVVQRQVSTALTVQKAMEVPPLQSVNRVVDVLVVAQRQMPRIVEETHNLVPHIMEKTIEVMKPVPQERVQNNTVERIVDVPNSQIQEETVGVIQLLPQDRMPERTVEQVVDVPVSQVQERDVCSHRAVDVVMALQAEVPAVQVAQKTVETPKARIPDEVADIPVAVQHQVPMVPQLQFIDELVHVAVATQRQIPRVEKIRKTMDTHRVIPRQAPTIMNEKERLFQAEIDRMVQETETYPDADDTLVADQHQPVVMQRQGAILQATQKTVEVPQIQYIDKIVDAPVVVTQQPVPMDDETLSQGQCFQRIEDDSVAVKQQGCERPLSPKKRRLSVETESGFESGEQLDLDAESNHERFKDLVLPSFQSCLEREILCVRTASSDEDGDDAGDGSTEGWTEVKKRGRKKPTKKSTASSDGEQEEIKQQSEPTSLVQGGDCGR